MITVVILKNAQYFACRKLVTWQKTLTRAKVQLIRTVGAVIAVMKCAAQVRCRQRFTRAFAFVNGYWQRKNTPV